MMIAVNSSDLPVTTSLVHRPMRYVGAWWKSAIITDVPGSLGLKEIAWLNNRCEELSAAGCNAMIIRPSNFDFAQQPQELARLIDRARDVGLRVIVRLCGLSGSTDLPFEGGFKNFERDPEHSLQRAEVALECGAVGLDLGMLPADLDQASDNGQTGSDAAHFARACHRLCYEHLGTSLVSAFALGAGQPQFEGYMQNFLYQHLRDETLLESPWSAQALRDRISSTLELRDKYGHVACWRASSSVTELAKAPAKGAWFEQNAPVRRAGLSILSLALPGAANVRASRLMRLPWISSMSKFYHMTPEDHERARVTLTRAQQIRTSRNLGTGSLAWITGLDWAGPDLFVHVGANTMVVLNTTEDAVRVPRLMQPLVTSASAMPTDDDAGRTLQPGECGWFAFGTP